MKVLPKVVKYNRRAILSAAAILPASAATAFVAPTKQAESPDLPDWWKKLTTQVKALNDTAVPHIGGGDRYVVVRRDRLETLMKSLSVIS